MQDKSDGIKKIMLLLAIILMDLLAGMEFDLFVPSFPELQNHFILSPFYVESLLSINFIGYCISLFVVGILADRHGRKPIILAGVLIFIVGCFLCLLAQSYLYLFVGRFLQGLGIAAPAILSFLIIADTYPLKKQQYFMAMLNGVKNTAVAIAPVIGSYITLYFHWQGNFILLLSLGFLVLIMSIIFVPHSNYVELKNTNKSSGYLSLFKSKFLILLMANIIFMFVPYWIFVGMSPLLYMKDLGVSLSHFGYYQGGLALVFALGSVLFGLSMHHFTQKKILNVATVIYTLSLISILFVSIINTPNPFFITLAFIPFIISQIIPSTLLVPQCLNFIPQSKAKISAVLQGFQLLSSALSVSIAGYFYQGSFQNIGMIITVFIFMAVVTHILVIKNLYNGNK